MNLFSMVKSLKFLHIFSIYENNLECTSEYFGQLNCTKFFLQKRSRVQKVAKNCVNWVLQAISFFEIPESWQVCVNDYLGRIISKQNSNISHQLECQLAYLVRSLTKKCSK